MVESEDAFTEDDEEASLTDVEEVQSDDEEVLKVQRWLDQSIRDWEVAMEG